MVYGAKWFEPTVQHLTAYVKSQNQKVSGQVKLKLYKGSLQVVALSLPNSLFNHNLATFNKNYAFNQNSSAGFIEIYNLAQKIAYNLQFKPQFYLTAYSKDMKID